MAQPLRPYTHPLPTHRLLAATGMLFEPVHCLVGGGRHERPLAAPANPTQTQVECGGRLKGQHNLCCNKGSQKECCWTRVPAAGVCEAFTRIVNASQTQRGALSGTLLPAAVIAATHNESAAAANPLQLPNHHHKHHYLCPTLTLSCAAIGCSKEQHRMHLLLPRVQVVQTPCCQ